MQVFKQTMSESLDEFIHSFSFRLSPFITPPTYPAHVPSSGCPSSCNPSLGNIHIHSFTHTHYGQFSLPNSPVPHVFGLRGKPEHPKSAQTQGEHANSTQKCQLSRGSNQRPSCCEANV